MGCQGRSIFRLLMLNKGFDMTSNTIKELVKKHFNLVEVATEPAQESFGEIKTADGELTLTYAGEELAQGLEVFIVTEDGNLPAPDGEHSLEGGITIVTADGKIEAIMETEEEAPAEGEEIAEEVTEEETEETLEEEAEEAMEEEETMEEDSEETLEEEEDETMTEEEEALTEEETISAMAEAVKDAVEKMMEDVEERMKALEDKYATFSAAPATEKTIAKKQTAFKKTSKSRNEDLMASLIAQKKNLKS